MRLKNDQDHYGSLPVAMHWLMLLLLIGVYSCIELRELYPKGSDPREALKHWHFMLGLTVFALLWLRVAIRLRAGPAPIIKPTMGIWTHRLAKLMHLALYLFLLVMPVLGWLTLSAKGKVIPFFGLELPPLLAADKALSHSLEDIHTTIGTIGYYLIGLHALAALLHHYVLRDNTLRRMLPARHKSHFASWRKLR